MGVSEVDICRQAPNGSKFNALFDCAADAFGKAVTVCVNDQVAHVYLRVQDRGELSSQPPFPRSCDTGRARGAWLQGRLPARSSQPYQMPLWRNPGVSHLLY